MDSIDRTTRYRVDPGPCKRSSATVGNPGREKLSRGGRRRSLAPRHAETGVPLSLLRAVELDLSATADASGCSMRPIRERAERVGACVRRVRDALRVLERQGRVRCRGKGRGAVKIYAVELPAGVHPAKHRSARAFDVDLVDTEGRPLPFKARLVYHLILDFGGPGTSFYKSTETIAAALDLSVGEVKAALRALADQLETRHVRPGEQLPNGAIASALRAIRRPRIFQELAAEQHHEPHTEAVAAHAPASSPATPVPVARPTASVPPRGDALFEGVTLAYRTRIADRLHDEIRPDVDSARFRAPFARFVRELAAVEGWTREDFDDAFAGVCDDARTRIDPVIARHKSPSTLNPWYLLADRWHRNHFRDRGRRLRGEEKLLDGPAFFPDPVEPTAPPTDDQRQRMIADASARAARASTLARPTFTEPDGDVQPHAPPANTSASTPRLPSFATRATRPNEDPYAQALERTRATLRRLLLDEPTALLGFERDDARQRGEHDIADRIDEELRALSGPLGASLAREIRTHAERRALAELEGRALEPLDELVAELAEAFGVRVEQPPPPRDERGHATARTFEHEGRTLQLLASAAEANQGGSSAAVLLAPASWNVHAQSGSGLVRSALPEVRNASTQPRGLPQAPDAQGARRTSMTVAPNARTMTPPAIVPRPAKPPIAQGVAFLPSVSDSCVAATIPTTVPTIPVTIKTVPSVLAVDDPV